MCFRNTSSRQCRLSLLAVLLLGVCIVGCQMADGQNLSGVRLYEQGQYQSALQQFQQALIAAPTNADAHYNMAATYHRIGVQNQDQEALTQAETLYNQCLDLDEDHTDCYRGLAVLLVQTGRRDSGFLLLKNWSTKKTTDANPRVELARLYHESGDHETAKHHLNQALIVDQDNHRAWAALGRIREEQREFEQALANYQRSYNLNQFQPGVAQRIAALNRQLQGDFNVTSPANGTRTVTRGIPRF